jgi:hypothetical protein
MSEKGELCKGCIEEPYYPECSIDHCPYVEVEDLGEDDVEEGEINLFSSMPWINNNIGSIMEYQLTKYKEPNQCRQCGKFDESIRSKEVPEKFCGDECRKKWHDLLEVRIAQGKHDLRVRGFD